LTPTPSSLTDTMFARAICKAMKPAVYTARVQVRQFSDALGIPTDKEQQWGRRKEEMDAEASGEIAFDHEESIVPHPDSGTKENPILVRDCLDKIVP
jgi:hypothetical protein